MSQEEILKRLRSAIADYQPSGLVDPDREKAKAKVRERALSLLDYRARSRHELQQRLLKAGYDTETVEEILDDLQEVGLLDDASFAQEWVSQRARRRGKSTRVLARELRDKGVGAEERREALSQVSEAEERATAKAVARKKARGIKSVPEGYRERNKDLRRVLGVLARRGFPEEMALALATEVVEERYGELRTA